MNYYIPFVDLIAKRRKELLVCYSTPVYSIPLHPLHIHAHTHSAAVESAFDWRRGGGLIVRRPQW